MTDTTTNSLVLFEPKALDIVLDEVRSIAVMKPEDSKFLVEHKEHLTAVMEKTFMWRTSTQKRSIISDSYHPTLHSKFHQAILEQKVQLDQTFYLAKDFEEKRLTIEETLLDIKDLEVNPDLTPERKDLAMRRLQMKLSFQQYELQQQQIAMHYRMDEVKGWQVLQEDLLAEMRATGMDEEAIWSKEAGEVESMFFQFLTNLQGLAKSSDGAEANNLVSLAKFGIQQAKELGLFENFKSRCNVAQLNSLKFLGEQV